MNKKSERGQALGAFVIHIILVASHNFVRM